MNTFINLFESHKPLIFTSGIALMTNGIDSFKLFIINIITPLNKFLSESTPTIYHLNIVRPFVNIFHLTIKKDLLLFSLDLKELSLLL